MRKENNTSEISKRDKNKISVTQFMILMWGGLLSPIMELLLTVTTKSAPKGAFLTPLLALPVLLITGYIIRDICGDGCGFVTGIEKSYCKFSASVVLGFYVIWGILLLALQLQLCANSFSAVGYKEGSQFFILPLIAIFVFWMSGFSFSGFARGASVFFGMLLIMLFLVLALSIPDVKLTRVLPVWTSDILGIVEGTFAVLGILGYVFYCSFFLGEVEWSKEEKKNGNFFIAWCVAGCVGLSLFIFIATGTFGASLLSDMAQPFLQLAKGVRVQGAFQRIEALVASLWTLADFILMGVILRGTATAFLRILSLYNKKISQATIMGVLVFLSSFMALTVTNLEKERDYLFLLGNLCFAWLLPMGLFFVKKVLHFPKKRGILREQH